jgi:hypothetical protein
MPTGPRPHPPANTVRTVVLGTLGPMPYVNVFHAFLPNNSISSDGQLATWASAWHTAFTNSGILAKCSNTLHVTTIEHVLFISPLIVYRAQGAVSDVGGAALPSLTSGVCFVISWNSSAYWRGGKPRTYLGGVTSASVDTNHSLLDSEKAVVQANANTLRTNINQIVTAQVPETDFVFTSYQSAGQWRNPPVNIEITGAVVHDRVGSQRRRLGPWLP